jgi:clathrin heavy chain
MDSTLWEKVLVKGEDGEELANTRSLIDQIVDWALPESDSADEVSATVKAFLAADIPGELINLLERIVLQGSDFSENRNLQNLLILTAIQAAPQKVSEYIDRLDHFDGPEIAQIAISEQHELFEEGLSIYQKFAKPEFETDEDVRIEMQGCALSVLVDHLADLDRARSFAERCNQPTVWSKLGRAQLDAHLAAEAIASYLAAEDPSEYVLVAEEANEAGIWETLIPFLRMARKTIKENGLDTELIYSLAKTDALAELEEFVSGPNCANIQDIGDRSFHEEMFAAAKLM